MSKSIAHIYPHLIDCTGCAIETIRVCRKCIRSKKPLPQKTIESMNKWRSKNKIKIKWEHCRKRANLRGTGIATYDGFKSWYENAAKRCHYCNKDISDTDKSIETRLCIDRKNNNLGYVLGNMCFSCHRCNTIKNKYFTEDQMLRLVETLNLRIPA